MLSFCLYSHFVCEHLFCWAVGGNRGWQFCSFQGAGDAPGVFWLVG
uniref:Uncharacterized protein n=1 Tax=Anguilla anguilla TaxID=7936 RepID=A0A0E9U7G7_ANGAN